MPAADLKNDIRVNVAELVAMRSQDHPSDDPNGARLATFRSHGEEALANHLQHTLWPFLEGLVDQLAATEAELEEASDVIEELGDAVDELTENRGSILMPQEAGVFALVIQLARSMLVTIEKGGTPTPDQITGMKMACDAAEKTITEITINVDLDSEDDEEDEEDEDDDD